MTCRRFVVPITALLWCVPAADAQQISSDEELKRLRDINFERQGDAAPASLARQEFEDYRGLAKEMNDKLTKLLADAEWLATTATNLLTDDDGKRIAAKETSITTFQEVLPNRLIPVERVRTKKKICDIILAAADAAIKRNDEGQVMGMPSSDARQALANLVGWVGENGPIIENAFSQLRGLIANAPKDIDLANAPTLQSVLDYANAKALEALSEAVARGRQLAKPESDKVLIEASYLADLKKSHELKKKIETEADIEVRRIRAEYEEKLRIQREDELKRIAQADAHAKDLEAQLAAQKKATDAARFAETVKSDIETGQVVSAAEHDRLVAKAKTVDIQTRLKPFLAKGYWQPGQKKRGIDSKAMSLSALRAWGALDYSQEGLQKFLSVGTAKGPGGSKNENDRSDVWGYPSNISRLSPTQLEELKQNQKDLIELGEVMVELGMLAP